MIQKIGIFYLVSNSWAG